MDSIIKGLIDKKIEKILKVFLKDKNKLFHIDAVSKKSQVPLSTSFRIIKKLVKLNIIEIIPIGKLKVYRLIKNKKTRILAKLIANEK